MGKETVKIQDYAIIGNGRSAALISRRGSVDWLCWPRFDSPSIFGAIVDPKVGGCWRIRPVNESQITRRYIDNTNVLETTFSNGSGEIVLTDFMPVTSEEHKKRILWPEHELVRQVRCTQGENEVMIDFIPRPITGASSQKSKIRGGSVEGSILGHVFSHCAAMLNCGYATAKLCPQSSY